MKLLALAILIIGIAAGAVIYHFADEPQAQAYIIVGDTVYPVDPASSKTYQRQLQRYGGKMAVMFDDINRWIAARFEGKQLGVTVAAALVVFAVAERKR